MTSNKGYLQFSSNLMALCTLYGLTDEDICKICNVSLSKVQKWKAGARVPVSCAMKIANSLGIAVSEMF